MTIRLSRRARRDLDEIRRYTVETWGREQWLAYCWPNTVELMDPDTLSAWILGFW